MTHKKHPDTGREMAADLVVAEAIRRLREVCRAARRVLAARHELPDVSELQARITELDFALDAANRIDSGNPVHEVLRAHCERIPRDYDDDDDALSAPDAENGGCVVTSPYRPSNGAEGMDFMTRYCENCARVSKDGSACRILVRTQLNEIDDPDYPSEWIEDADGPRCTAFRRGGAR